MNSFNQHYTYGKLLKYCVSPIVMMIFTSLYVVVDSLFVSNFTGKTAFAAANFIIPYLLMFTSFGFMFGAGGSALIAKTLGERRDRKAKEIFTNVFILSLGFGAAIATLGQLLIRPVAQALGAEGQLLQDSLIYGRIYLLGVPSYIIQFEFENLYAAAGKPKLGLFATILSGLTNIALDALFIIVFHWGLAGAAFATIIAQWIGGTIPMVYFSRDNASSLRFVKAKMDWHAMVRVCSNGISEVVNNVSISVVSMFYNVQLLKYAGNEGVAAYGVLMNMNFMFTAVFWGYNVGAAPLISFQYGADNRQEIHNLFKKSMILIFSASAIMFLLAETLSGPISALYVGYDQGLMDLTSRGFLIFSFNFLFAGVAIFSSSLFTALNNGLLSALISFLRTFVFQIGCILVLPIFWEIDGIWFSLVLAEFLTMTVGLILIGLNRKKYHY